MAITQFEQGTITKAGQAHEQESQQLRSQLQQLRTEVDSTLQRSTSQQTKALQSTYDQFFQGIEKMIVQRTTSLTEAMTTTARDQQDRDEQNASGMSSVAHFLGG